MIDTAVPHSARIWNYWLGGKDNYDVDRAAGDEFKSIYPEITVLAREARAFIKRSVTFLAREAGIRQFLDVGTGLPTEDNTHEVAQRVAPDARIVYVDNDPLVLTHARALLTSTPEGITRYLEADMHQPELVLAGAAETLDFDQPIALLFMGVLGHVEHLSEAQSIVARLLEAMVSGSYLALQDGTDVVSDGALSKALDEYADSGAVPYRVREPAEIRTLFDGLELVDPGFVSVSRWRPELAGNGPRVGSEVPAEVDHYGAVGRKP
jgi:S-adenosyl methyltransferase